VLALERKVWQLEQEAQHMYSTLTNTKVLSTTIVAQQKLFYNWWCKDLELNASKATSTTIVVPVTLIAMLNCILLMKNEFSTLQILALA
jgi:hypothetical protein